MSLTGAWIRENALPHAFRARGVTLAHEKPGTHDERLDECAVVDLDRCGRHFEIFSRAQRVSFQSGQISQFNERARRGAGEKLLAGEDPF